MPRIWQDILLCIKQVNERHSRAATFFDLHKDVPGFTISTWPHINDGPALYGEGLDHILIWRGHSRSADDALIGLLRGGHIKPFIVDSSLYDGCIYRPHYPVVRDYTKNPPTLQWLPSGFLTNTQMIKV